MNNCQSSRLFGYLIRVAAVGAALTGLVAATVTSVRAESSSATTPGTVEPEPPRGLLPDDDPFYDTPEGVDLAAVAPGQILRIRPLTVSAGTLPLPVDAWQILVRSTDSDGDPVPVAASILLPVVPWIGDGPQPLVSYQSPIDALGDHCQPSYTLRNGNEPELAVMAPAQLAGWAVVTTDFEGPRHAYGAGPMAAHGVLDGVRGALALEQANLAANAPVGFVGYSGGGQATTWAAEVQPTYAPELNVVGFAGGGVPVDLQEVARHLDGDLAAGIAIAAGVGIDREFPAMDLESILNDRGREVMAEVSDQCIDEFAFAYPGVTFADLSTHPDPLSLPQITDALDANSLGKATPSAPFYLWHSVADQLIPVSGPDRLAEYYCTEGDQPVYYDRNIAGEHITYAVAGAPGAFAFLADRFAGLPAPDNCLLVPVLTGEVVDDMVERDNFAAKLESANTLFRGW